MHRLALLALATLTGCNQIFGFGGEFQLSDAGGEPIDAEAIDAGPFDCPPAPPLTVIACATITHVRGDGTTYLTRKDLSGTTVAAYLPDDSAAGFQVVSGTASADGVVTIEGVPDGPPYYLRIHDAQDSFAPFPYYFVTDKHALELGYVMLGGDDSPVALDTQVTFDITGAQPWGSRHFLSYASFNAGTYGEIYVDPPPTAGATMLDTTFDWRTANSEISLAGISARWERKPQLLDSVAGDDFWVMQRLEATASTAAMRGYNVDRIVAVAEASLTLTDGAPVAVPAALEAATPVAGGQDFFMNLGAFRIALRDDDRYVEEELDCLRSTNPAGAYGLVDSSVLNISGPIWGGESQISLTDLPYANPFPASWPHVMRCSLVHYRYSIVPVSNRRITGISSLASFTTAAEQYTWTPATRAPLNIRIGGLDALAGGAVAFDGIAPVTISWDPVPGINRYGVRAIGITEGFFAWFDTSQAAVSMPADTFTKGNFYVFRVWAVQTDADYVGGDLNDLTIPLSYARVSTGMFLFSDDCGNNTVDAGEQCDTGGSTTTCDADCSLPVCGDGFVNSTLEACDETVNAPHCDDDCTVPVCNDGRWNPTIEQCDDGNAVETDACSNACVLLSCGNGTLEPPFESCDDGDRDNGDGCNAFCRDDCCGP